MKPFYPFLGLTLLAVIGCGPLTSPMPPRLKADDQKEIDASWEKALAPVDKLDRQRWLDLFVTTQAYQLGVDRLYFRSEKKFSGGKVVMEIRFDRDRPEADGFVVQVYDHGDKLVRRETYSRDEVETTYRELFTDPPAAAVAGGKRQEPADAAGQPDRRKQRLEAIQEYIPHFKQQEQKQGNAGPH